jgi:hypothetical protein
MPWLGVPEQIGAFEHPRHGFDRRAVQRDDAMARLVLAASNVQKSFDEIHIAPANVRRVAVLTAWADLGAARNLVPGGFGSLNARALGRYSVPFFER